MSTRLNQVCKLIVDCPHSTEPDEGEGYPIIRTPNIGRGYLDLEGVQRVSRAAFDRRNVRAAPQPGDLIMAREAPAGNVGIIREGMEVCLGQRTVLIRPDADKVNPLFLNYYLNAPEQRHGLLRNSNGATVSHVNMPIIRNLPVDLPDLETQRCIAGVLSAYDELIENNRKQIKLLEEAAQRLYKDWFVDLNFPGHETTPIHNGLPEGWRKARLVDVANVQYGFAFKANQFNSDGDGLPIIRIRNVVDGFSRDYTTEKADEKYLVYDGDTVVGMDGDFYINSWSGGMAYLVQRSCRIKAHDDRLDAYLRWAIATPIRAFQNGIVGATVAHLGKRHIDSIEVLIPSYGAVGFFSDMRNQIVNLRKQIAAAREARNRLLPKLMSGGIAGCEQWDVR